MKYEKWIDTKKETQKVKKFNNLLSIDNWDVYNIDTFTTEKELEKDYIEYYEFNIFFFENTFIIQINTYLNDNLNFENIKTYYHTENSLNLLFFDEPDVYSNFFNYLDKLKEKPETKNKIEKIKLSQKLKNF